MKRTVKIDSFPESALKYCKSHTIVAVDILRASTTVTTAVDLGRRVFPVCTTDEAFVKALAFKNPMLVGEIGGNTPYGFHITNSPAQIAERTDHNRPMVFLSSSGTRLMSNADSGRPVYISCLRNLSAVAGHLQKRFKRVAVLGAGTRGQFRREDQIGCAWLAERLLEYGFVPEDAATEEIISRWQGVDIRYVRHGRSAAYLKRTGQERDLEFILNHIDDLDVVPVMRDGEVSRWKS